MMNHRRIAARKFDESHCFENMPQLQKYLVAKKMRAAGVRNHKRGMNGCQPCSPYARRVVPADGMHDSLIYLIFIQYF